MDSQDVHVLSKLFSWSADFHKYFDFLVKSIDKLTREQKAKLYLDGMEKFLKTHQKDITIIKDGTMQYQEDAQIHLHSDSGLFISFEKKPHLYDTFCFITGYQQDGVENILTDKNGGVSHQAKKAANDKAVEEKKKRQSSRKLADMHFAFLSSEAKITKEQIRDCKKLEHKKIVDPNYDFTDKEEGLLTRHYN